VRSRVYHLFLLLSVSLLLLPSPLRAGNDIVLSDSIAQLGLASQPNQASDSADAERYASKNGIDLVADKNRDFLYIGGAKVFLSGGIRSYRGKLTVQSNDYYKVLLPLLWWSQPPTVSVRRIVIDPGHGGKDPGKISPFNSTCEKQLTLDTALRLKDILVKNGYEVILTREKDTWLDLDDRPTFATRAKADLFVSLHYNSAGANDFKSSGIETYAYTPVGQSSTNDASRNRSQSAAQPGNNFDTFNMVLAWSVHRRLLANTGAEDRGVRRAKFSVLRTLNCPGILVEGGFVSSRTEGALICDPAYRQKIAQSIAEGIMDYRQRTQGHP
jgi:N-acetylmuramoyl-L-alanine amidase